MGRAAHWNRDANYICRHVTVLFAIGIGIVVSIGIAVSIGITIFFAISVAIQLTVGIIKDLGSWHSTQQLQAISSAW